MAVYDPPALCHQLVRVKRKTREKEASLPMAMEATSFERNSMEERGGDDGLEADPSNSSSRAPGACVCAWSRLSDHRLTVSTQSPVLLVYFRTTSKCSTASLLLFHHELRRFVLGRLFIGCCSLPLLVSDFSLRDAENCGSK